MAKKSVISNTPFRFLGSVCLPYAPYALGAAVLVLFAAGLSQGLNYLFKPIVDAAGRGDVTTALLWGTLFPVAILLTQLLYRASGYIGGLLVTNATSEAQNILAEHVLRHSHSYYSDRFAGSVSSKVKNVSSGVENTIPDLLWNLLDTVVSYLVTIALVAMVDWRAAIIFVLLIVSLILLNIPFSRRKRELSVISSLAGTKLIGQLTDVVTNMSAVRQYAKTEAEKNHLKELIELERDAERTNWFYSEKMLLVNNLVIFIFSAGMFYLLIKQWQAEAITTGDFVLVLALVSQLAGSLTFIGQMFSRMGRHLGQMKEGLDDLLLPHDIIDAPNASKLKVDNGAVVFSNIRFHFGQTALFENFSFTVASGQRVGLVGTSGAGKSTIVSLLLRQYDVASGTIAIDGQDITRVTQDSLREAIAVVPQEPLLFHRTIRENIVYGSKGEVTEEELVEAAKRAQAHSFISELPEGYDTVVGERGVKLSGGQRQRIAIARAMLKNAPILVLDEATSALDSESEVAIQKALHFLMAGKTVVAIAHRLSTLREMDRIVVLDGGKIVEDGTHETLKALGGVYARLWDYQSGGFLQENEPIAQ